MTSNSVTPRGAKPKKLSAARIVVYSVLVVALMYYLLPLYVITMT